MVCEAALSLLSVLHAPSSELTGALTVMWPEAVSIANFYGCTWWCNVAGAVCEHEQACNAPPSYVGRLRARPVCRFAPACQQLSKWSVFPKRNRGGALRLK